MFCPKCGCEYREGYFKCSDCHVALVNELPEVIYKENKHNKVAQSAWELIKQKLMNNKKFEKIVFVSLIVSCFALLLSNVFRLKFNSLWSIGPEWEIPVGLTTPILITKRLSDIFFYISLITGLVGVQSLIKQKLWIKVAYVMWFILIICNTLDFKSFSGLYGDHCNFVIFVLTIIFLIEINCIFKARNNNSINKNKE